MIELQSGKTTVLEQVRDLALDAGMLAEVAATDLLLADACACTDGPVAALERSDRIARDLLRHSPVVARNVNVAAQAPAAGPGPDTVPAVLKPRSSDTGQPGT